MKFSYKEKQDLIWSLETQNSYLESLRLGAVLGHNAYNPEKIRSATTRIEKLIYRIENEA